MNDPANDPLRLLDDLRVHAEERGDAVAYQEVTATGDGRRLTYRQLHDHTLAAAAHLQRYAAPGEVVLIACPNRIELPIAILGAWAAGCIAFPISADSTASERADAARASGAVVAVMEGDCPGVTTIAPSELTPSPGTPGEGGGEGNRSRKDECRAKNECDAQILHSAFCIPPLTSPHLNPLPEYRERAPAIRLLLKSSGTTGRPQIVCRSAQSINAVCDQMVRALAITPDDRVLAIVPLSHSYGIEHGLLMPLTIGATVHLCPNFQLPLVLSELDRAAITFLPGVPSMYEMLTGLGSHGQRWPALRRAYSAGAALPRTVFNRARELFDLTIEQLYGATEVGSITFNDKGSGDFDPQCVGLPMDGVQATVVSVDDARPMQAGEEGQLCVRANSMFDRYLDPAAEVKWIDGFFATGDIASMDDRGRITISGRLSLLIDVGGLKVNPIEVEEVICRHAGVAACVVLPVRQSQTVCRMKAIVTPTDANHPPAIESLRQFAREHLASYKVPRSFEVRASLPRTQTGKILRHLVDA